MYQHTAPPRHGDVWWTPRARPLVAALVLGLALAVTACGSGTPIGSASAPHATPPPTQTPTPVPSLAPTWRIIPSLTSPNPTRRPNSQLAAVSALAPTDAWAVGFTYADGDSAQPLIERWDGATWHVVPSPSTNRLTNVLQGVAAVAPRDVWAVGTASVVNPLGLTLIEHWNGTQWSIVPSPNPSANDNGLASVAASAPNDVWAVGTSGMRDGTSCCVHLPLIERWDGAAWHVVANPALPGATDSTLATVATIPGTKQLWAVGAVRYGPRPAYEQALIERWDGAAWHVVAPAAPPRGAFIPAEPSSNTGTAPPGRSSPAPLCGPPPAPLPGPPCRA